MTVLKAPFDPVTQSEIEQIKKYRRHKRIRDVFLAVEENGVLPLDGRISLLKKAIKPYRHIHLDQSFMDEAIMLDDKDEEKVRAGFFRLAAKGIRGELIGHNLYFEEIVKRQCNEHRAAHSVSVAHTAMMIGQAHHLDPDIIYKAGYLHDITKKMKDDEAEKIIRIYKPEWLSLSPKIWHSYTALIWLKQNMGLYDYRILNAIEHHTLGDASSPYALTLYIADKIEPTRGYDAAKELAVAKKSLRQGADLIIEESRQYRLSKENKRG